MGHNVSRFQHFQIVFQIILSKLGIILAIKLGTLLFFSKYSALVETVVFIQVNKYHLIEENKLQKKCPYSNTDIEYLIETTETNLQYYTFVNIRPSIVYYSSKCTCENIYISLGLLIGRRGRVASRFRREAFIFNSTNQHMISVHEQGKTIRWQQQPDLPIERNGNKTFTPR